MKIYSLVKNIHCRVYGSRLIDVTGLYHKHTEVQKGGVFFCINGASVNGEDYLFEAIKNGAVAVVVKNEISGLKNVTQIIVNDVRKCMSLMSANFYLNPAKKLKIIGVTGTNGKTTTSHMIAGLLNGLNKESAVIGTNGVIYKDLRINTSMTTPDPIELHEILAKLLKLGVEYVCMEVSAHAIYLNKLEGIKFEIMIFTNLTEDHLDYFKNYGKLLSSKEKNISF